MMPSASTGAEHPVLVAAARHGLGAVASVTVLHAPDAGWVLESAQQDHLTGFLADAVVDGAVTIADPTVSGGLMTNWHLELAACLDLERLTIDTGRLLDDAGIRWRLTKGLRVRISTIRIRRLEPLVMSMSFCTPMIGCGRSRCWEQTGTYATRAICQRSTTADTAKVPRSRPRAGSSSMSTAGLRSGVSG